MSRLTMLLPWLLVAGLALGGFEARAITLSVVPSASEVPLGEPLFVALRIDGLGEGEAPSLGVFDLRLDFDAGTLGVTDIDFGDPALGDQLDLGFGSMTRSDTTTAGAIELLEISLAPEAELDSLQASSFTLATVSFDTIGAGSSPLDLTPVSLGDALGEPLVAEVRDATVTVTAVPEPGGSLVFLLGWGLVWSRVRH